MRFDLAGRFQTPQKVLQWSKVSHISFWAHRSKLCSSRIKLGISSCSVLTFQRDLSSHIRLLFSCHDMSHITQLDKYYIRGDTNLELRPIKDIESRTPHGCNEEHPRHQESLPRLMMLLNLHVDPMVRVPQPTMDPARGVPLENFAWMRSDSIPKGLTWLDNQRVEFDLHGLPRGTGICLGLLQDKTVPEIAPHVVDVQKPVILPTHTGANYQQIVITFWVRRSTGYTARLETHSALAVACVSAHVAELQSTSHYTPKQQCHAHYYQGRAPLATRWGLQRLCRGMLRQELHSCVA